MRGKVAEKSTEFTFYTVNPFRFISTEWLDV